MQAPPKKLTKDEAKKLLQTLRDEPVTTQGSQDNILAPLYDFVQSFDPGGGELHWFCCKAFPLVAEASVFLLRLFAYSSERITVWKRNLIRCLHGCCACIKAFEDAKETSRTTYFGAFQETVIWEFWNSFALWETEEIVKALNRAGISLNADKTLANAPIPVVYHLVSTPVAFRDRVILNLLETKSPLSRIDGWPDLRPPPGFLLLLMHQHGDVRKWVKAHVSQIKVFPKEQFTRPYMMVLRMVVEALSSGSSSSRMSEGSIMSVFPIPSDSEALWHNFIHVIPLVPREVLQSKDNEVRMSRFIIGHLNDNAPHFPTVLRSFVYLIKKIGKGIWTDESAQYPQVVFDSVKDNPQFQTLIMTTDNVREKPYLLLWFSEYLTSIWNLPVFGEVMAKMVEFLLVELQHERFGGKRPFILEVALKMISGIVDEVALDNSSQQSLAVSSVIDVHADFIIAVALSEDYSRSAWTPARNAALDLLQRILYRDIDCVANAIIQLTVTPKTIDDVPIVKPMKEQMWKKVYSSVRSNNGDGIGLILALSARGSKLDRQSTRAFQDRIGKFMRSKQVGDTEEFVDAVEVTIKDINSSLKTMRNGYLDAITRCANFSSPSALLELLQRPNIIKYIVELMLSPIEDLHVGAQTLIGQAFDADVRIDCFRALFENSLQESLRGIQDYVEKFNAYAPQVIEACSVSKSLVQCLTDVIEVLGNSPDGLLLNERYVRSNSSSNNFKLSDELLRFWKLMTNAIAVIFKRTPSWAPYFDNKVMVEWMRDALIFARDLLERRRAFENAILSARGEEIFSASPRKLSPVGKKMAMDLQDVLLNLHGWLRLTDPELLHQSFALLRSMLAFFKDTKMEPSPEILTKLTAFVEAGRNKDTSRRTSILNSVQLSQLENDLAYFAEESESESEEEDIVITGHVKPPKRLPKVVDASKRIETVKKPQELSLRDILKAQVEKRKKVDSNRSSSLIDSLSKSAKPIVSVQSSKPVPAEPVKPAPVASSSKPIQARFIGDPRSRATSRSSSAPSTSSSSEDEEGDEMGGLKSLAKLQRSPEKIKKPTERRQIKLIDDPVMSAKRAMQKRLEALEASRRQTMRLAPDITPLLRTILSWDYDQADVNILGQKQRLQRVSDRFSDPHAYRQTFEPLLMLECWSQIVQSKEGRAPEIYECKVAGRQFVDDWLDLEAMISVPVRREWRITENDIVLLRNADSKRSIMAKGTAFKPTFTGVQVSLRCCVGTSGDPGLNINSTWSISIVFSLSTLKREYAAMVALPYYDHVDSILRAKLPAPVRVDHRDVEQAMTAYQVNEPQAKAIVMSMNTEGFSLIQGPPGTGKTSTICGLVGAFLSTRRSPATNITVGRSSGPPQRQPVKKVLVCAPSNAAIDEVAKRLMEGVRDVRGNRVVPKVVRVGAEKSIHHSVKDIALETLVDQRLSGERKDNGSGSQDINAEIASLRIEIAAVKEDKQKKQQEIASIVNNAARALALEEEFKRINSRWMSLSQRLNQLKDKQKAVGRTADADRRRFRLEILDEADIICSTLSGSGHEMLDKYDFEMIIVDEAAQSIELSSLIPLKYRCNRCVMVGDPNQLPPTVLSTEATKWGYDQSLFVRMQKQQPGAVHLLSIQYRMHPDISQLPSQIFYDGRLRDGADMALKTRKVWHNDERFGAYKFYSVKNGREESAGIGHSLVNKAECQVILALFDRLRREYTSFDFDNKIGIVSMYKAQVLELKKTFQLRYGPSIVETVDFNTVDGFQGQEKDIIILSCVRAGTTLATVGFLADVRRMNVAITRARSSLFIVGNAPTLERSNETWKNIVNDARARSRFREVDVEYFRAPRAATNPTISAQSPKKPSTLKRQLSNKTVPAEDMFPVKKQRKVESSPHEITPTTPATMAAPAPVAPASSNLLSSNGRPVPAATSSARDEHLNALPKRPIDSLHNEQGDGSSSKKIKDPDKALKALEKRRKQKQNSLFINQGKR